MPGPVDWSCDCGDVQVTLQAGGGLRGICYCKDCQAFARHLGHEGDLDEVGGSDVYQTTPNLITFQSGQDKLACLKLTPKGLNRWYASCCNTPMVNTPSTIHVPFASFMLAHAKDRDAAGKIRARVNTDGATGLLPKKAHGLAVMMYGVLGRALTLRLAGKHKETPFFGDDGRPVAKPHHLTPEERKLAYPD